MKEKKFILIPVLSMTSVMTSFLALGPILAEIGKNFPKASSSQVQLVFTIGSLVALPVMLLAGKAANYIVKKHLALLGLFVMLIGGILPVFANSRLWMLYISSSFLGFGMAFVNIIGATLISDHFRGLDKGTAMGFNSAAFSLGGAALSWATGTIASRSSWTNSYLIFLIIIPVIIITVVMLPKDSVSQPQESKSEGKVLNGRLLWFAFLNFISSAFINAFSANIAMFLDTTGLGGADISGIVSSIYMLIGIPAGMLLGIILKKLKRNTLCIMSLCIAAGMLCIAMAQNLPMVYLGTFLAGIGFSIRTPACTTFASNLVPAASAGMGIALVNSFASIGNFASPMIVNSITFIIGGNARTVFHVCTAALIILAVAYTAFNPLPKDDSV